MKVVIDTDPGTDDALALMMALNSTDLDILGLTTVGGNISLASTTRNALRLLDYLGHPEIPVSPGASRPLGGRRFQYAPYFHGRSGLTVRLPQASVNPIPTRAHNYILSLASAFRGELVVLSTASLSAAKVRHRGKVQAVTVARVSQSGRLPVHHHCAQPPLWRPNAQP